jgi:hypothetical protein
MIEAVQYRAAAGDPERGTTTPMLPPPAVCDRHVSPLERAE